MAIEINYGTGRRKTSAARVFLEARHRRNRRQRPAARRVLRPRDGAHDRAPAAHGRRRRGQVRHARHRARRRHDGPSRARFVTASRARSWTTTRRLRKPLRKAGSSRATRAKSSARRSVCARRAGARSSRSANLAPARVAEVLRSRSDDHRVGGSSSGRTSDSDSENLGSNPSPPATLARSANRAHLGRACRRAARRRPIARRFPTVTTPGIWLKRVSSSTGSRSAGRARR